MSKRPHQFQKHTDDPAKLGINFFNRQDYWEAHEAWEFLWKRSSPPLKDYLQGLIQACASFHHLKKSRLKPAVSLAKLSTAKIAGMRPAVIEIENLQEILKEVTQASEPSVESTDSEAVIKPLLKKIGQLKAKTVE